LALDQIHIEISIVVEVNQPGALAGDLGDGEVPGHAVEVIEIDTCRRSDVDKDGPFRRRCDRSRQEYRDRRERGGDGEASAALDVTPKVRQEIALSLKRT